MLNGKPVLIVMPAHNAARTPTQTVVELPREMVDEALVVDDHSSDATVRVAREPWLTTFGHRRNLGCGRNQKTGCAAACAFFWLIPLWLMLLPEDLQGKTTHRWSRGMALAF